MHVETLTWTSRESSRSLPLVRYGDRGLPLVYVPSSGGDEREFAAYGMPEVCRPWIDAGRLQVFSIDGCGSSTLFDDGLEFPERIRRYAAFERDIRSELLPRVGRLTGVSSLAVVGASYGGFVAANLLFKVPRHVVLACGLGGVYGLWHRLGGYHDDDVYLHTPLEYLPRLDDPATLGAIRATRGMALYAAASDPWLDSTVRLQRALQSKALPHRVRVWPAPADHHERWWREQLADFVGHYLDGSDAATSPS